MESDSNSSGPEKVEDNEEDFEDRDPDRSGGDPGTLVAVVVILRLRALDKEVSERVGR